MTGCQVGQKYLSHTSEPLRQVRVGLLSASEICFPGFEYLGKYHMMVDRNLRQVQQRNFIKPGMLRIKYIQLTIQDQMVKQK